MVFKIMEDCMKAVLSQRFKREGRQTHRDGEKSILRQRSLDVCAYILYGEA